MLVLPQSTGLGFNRKKINAVWSANKCSCPFISQTRENILASDMLKRISNGSVHIQLNLAEKKEEFCSFNTYITDVFQMCFTNQYHCFISMKLYRRQETPLCFRYVPQLNVSSPWNSTRWQKLHIFRRRKNLIKQQFQKKDPLKH